MIKLVQFIGALLGTLIGFYLGLLILQQAPGAVETPNRPAFLAAMVAASLLFGYLAIPYVTIYPARWVRERIRAADAGSYALGVAAIVVGLIMGVLLGIPLALLGGTLGRLLPPLATLLLVAGMLAATISKRDVLLPALGSVLPGARRRGAPQTVVVDTSAVIDGRIVDIGKTGFIMGSLMVPSFVLDELQRIADSPDAMRRNRGRRGLEMLTALQKDSVSPVEIVDTSAIIDGRLVDLSKTGFIMGTLVVPKFVLEELQRIADSPDALRRNRGRRGLEMLTALGRDSVSPVEISDETYPEINEVDAKLVAYARDRNAAILTNDFNLNRVAELQGIKVLNINELANAVKQVLHPGEEMLVRIIQDGKEPGQGVGYLDDGTMIVVENGARHMDHEIAVSVTRVLQTVAGRMIFAQPRADAAAEPHHG